jgi:hypothetical protein
MVKKHKPSAQADKEQPRKEAAAWPEEKKRRITDAEGKPDSPASRAEQGIRQRYMLISGSGIRKLLVADQSEQRGNRPVKVGESAGRVDDEDDENENQYNEDFSMAFCHLAYDPGAGLSHVFYLLTFPGQDSTLLIQVNL